MAKEKKVDKFYGKFKINFQEKKNIDNLLYDLN